MCDGLERKYQSEITPLTFALLAGNVPLEANLASSLGGVGIDPATNCRKNGGGGGGCAARLTAAVVAYTSAVVW